MPGDNRRASVKDIVPRSMHATAEVVHYQHGDVGISIYHPHVCHRPTADMVFETKPRHSAKLRHFRGETPIKARAMVPGAVEAIGVRRGTLDLPHPRSNDIQLFGYGGQLDPPKWFVPADRSAIDNITIGGNEDRLNLLANEQ